MGWGTQRRAGPSLEGKDAPPDVANLAYLIFFCLGVAILLPWNSFITAADYFEYLYPKQHIDRVLTVSYLFPCLVALCFLTFFGRHYSSWIRINSGLALYLLCIVLVPSMHAIFIEVDEQGSHGTYAVTAGALVVTGIADALVQGSVVGEAGELPERYMQAFVSGSAASGVLVSALRITTKAALPRTPEGLRQSANVYFGVSAAFLALCLVGFNLSHKLPVLQYYRSQRLKLVSASDGEETEPLATPEELDGEDGTLKNLKVPSWRRRITEKSSYKHVLGQVKWQAASVALIYVISLSIFPGFISEDVHSDVMGDWYPVLLIASFNVADLLGRQATGLYIPESIPAVMGGSVGRLLFIPLFALVVRGPRVFRTEASVFLLTSLLGATNGFVTACHMIVAPKTVPLAEAETTSIVMTISLILGLTMGSVLSWLWEV